MTKTLQHVGVLGMHWGQRRGQKGTTGHKPRPAQVRSAIGTMAKTTISKTGNAAKNTAKNVGEAFAKKHKSRKVTEADLEFSRQYVKNYLKLAGVSVVAGLVVTQAGRMAAQAYITAREVQRYKDLFE